MQTESRLTIRSGGYFFCRCFISVIGVIGVIGTTLSCSTYYTYNTYNNKGYPKTDSLLMSVDTILKIHSELEAKTTSIKSAVALCHITQAEIKMIDLAAYLGRNVEALNISKSVSNLKVNKWSNI